MGLFGKDPEYVGTIRWEAIRNEGEGNVRDAFRAKVPGGWLFIAWWGPTWNGSGATFIPDPKHEWDGNSA